MSNTDELCQRLADEADLCRNDGANDIAALLDEARAALAQQPAASGEPAEPLKGWKLNHVQKGPARGMAQIGYLDEEDGRFSHIVTVDTGLYDQNEQAYPLAVAILGALADATPHQTPARVPLTDAQIDSITRELWGQQIGVMVVAHRLYARAVLAAADMVAKDAP